MKVSVVARRRRPQRLRHMMGQAAAIPNTGQRFAVRCPTWRQQRFASREPQQERDIA
jgi:hypothetical protein